MESTSKGQRTRAAVLAAAIERFGRDGFRATSVADVARDAGVGGSVTYAYFPNKEALFLAALDEDAAAVIQEGVSHLLIDSTRSDWRAQLIFTLVDSLERHPLARRVLAGLEPDVTDRVAHIPAMLELRKTAADKLATDQLDGIVRHDIDASAVANGLVTITLALVMSVLQFGRGGIDSFGADVWAVLDAALQPPR